VNKSAARTSFVEPVTEDELLEGIDSDTVVLMYQPKVSIKDKKMTGVEALARWWHPERGILGPAAFIPLAENLGRIDELTQNVLRQAVAQGGQWIRDGLEIGISVNYSVGSLQHLILPEQIVSMAKEWGMNPELMTIEVTESLVVQEFASTIEVLTRLRLLGIGLALDDFGTGHASMERLQQIPFTELKLDRAYVCDAAMNATSRAILESSISLGRGLGMKLVAEGVEDQASWDLVAALGCDEVQGYFVAKPMPGEEIIPWKQAWENR
jgi:EAL domain-containing protein (putative c-di-GMP-specific phosphodiesterase class I)